VESAWAASFHLLRPRRKLLSHRKAEKILDNNFGTRIFSPIISHPFILFSHRPSLLSHGRGPRHSCLSQSGFLYASRLMLRYSSTLGCSSHRLQPSGRPWTPQSLVGSIEHSTKFSAEIKKPFPVTSTRKGMSQALYYYQRCQR
jgi:hypothetical protein